MRRFRPKPGRADAPLDHRPRSTDTHGRKESFGAAGFHRRPDAVPAVRGTLRRLRHAAGTRRFAQQELSVRAVCGQVVREQEPHDGS